MTRHYRHNLHAAHGHWLARQLVVMALYELLDYLRRRRAERLKAPPRVPSYFNRPHRIHLWDKVRDKLES